MIKIILFDFDGVLALQDKYYAEHYCHVNGLDHTDWLAFWLNDFQDCLLGKTDCKQVMQKFFQSQALDIDIEAYFKDWFDYEYNLNTELFELIDKIRRASIKTYIASNQEQYKHEFFHDQPELTSHFDQIFTSSSLGHKKPEPQFWLKILETLNLQPHEVLFIDDTPKIVEAAQKLGIQSHHYTNFAEAQNWLKQHLDFEISNQTISNNIKLLLLIKLLGGLLFFVPIYALYLEESLFSLTNVGFILALESVAKSILEIPTGALSDIYGRKNVLIYASLIYLISVLFLLKGGSLIVFATYAILKALSRSLASGTDQALVYDTLLEENKEDQYPDQIGKLFAIRQCGAALGSLIGGFLAIYSYQHTIFWSLIPSLIAFILCFFLREPKLHKPVKKNLNLHIKDSLIEVLNKKPLFLIIILSAVLWGLGEPLYYYTSIFFEARQIDVQAMGILFAGAFGLSSLGHYFSAAVMRKISWQKLLILCLILSPLVDLFSTITFGYLAGILAIMPGLFFGVRNVIISTQTNALISHENRATILSISNAVDMVIITLCTIFVGYLADHLNITRVFQIFLSLELIIPLVIALLYLKSISRIPNS